MRYLLLPLFTFLFVLDVIAKPIVNINIEYQNYENDTLLIAYHFGEKILILDTLITKTKHKFEYKREEALDPGMYLLVTKPNNAFFQVLINDEDQEFKITTDFKDQSKTVIKGSIENEEFYAYIDYLSGQRIKLADIDSLVSQDILTVEEGINKKEALALKVEDYQKGLIKQYPDYIFSMIIEANMNLDIPEFNGTNEEKEVKKYHYFKEHYFDGIDLANPVSLRTPFLHKKVTYFLDKMTAVQSDSIIKSIDFILEKMKPAEKTFQYYLSHFLNSYGNSKYIGLDGVYVHLALTYYDKGLAPWVKEENLHEIVNNALSMEPTLIGKTAPDFTTFSEDGTSFTLSNFESEYTVLIFWAPNCGHCTKAMPFLVDFQEKYKADGVEVVSICNQVGKKYETCWEGVIEKNMMTFLNTGDQYMRSKILSKYFVRSTPLILILDKDKKILIKKIPAENMDGVMEQILESKKKKEEIEKG